MIFSKLFFLFVFLDVVSASVLEINFLNTGQGNCIPVKIVEQSGLLRVVFFDCGETTNCITVQGSLDDQENEFRKVVSDILLNATSCKFLLTHNHEDHWNLVNTIGRIFFNNQAASDSDMTLNGTVHYLKNNEETDFTRRKTDLQESVREAFWGNQAVVQKIVGMLGDKVEIMAIRPDDWYDLDLGGLSSNEHDYNVMYKVRFADRNILFPGDVSPQLFRRMLSDPRYHYELLDIDFMTLVHHGSDQSGELGVSFYAVNPEMVVACSNPDVQDKLPWGAILDLK